MSAGWVASRVNPFGAVQILDADVVPVALVYEQANAPVMIAAPELLDALRNTLHNYVRTVASGDCGDWDPEKEAHVIAARAAIAKAEGKA